MMSVLMVTGIGCILSGAIGIAKALNSYDLTIGVSKKETNNKLKGLPPGRDDEFSLAPEAFKIAKDDNPDLEKQYTDLMIKHDILKGKLKQYEDEDMQVQDEVKKLMKKDKKSSKLVDEIFSK